MAALKQDITATEQGRNSGVIALTYANADPERARRVLDEVTREYVHQNVARTSAEAASRLKFVTEQLPNVREELAKAQAALNQFQTRTQTLDVAVQNRALETAQYVWLGMWYGPGAARTSVVGWLTAPVTVLWNIEKK
jgi:tyrosine-protein kinase Etk/Wzc